MKDKTFLCKKDFHEMSKFIFVRLQTRNTFFIVFEIVTFHALLMKTAQM